MKLKKIKKIIILSFAALALFLLTGCSKENENMLTEKQQAQVQQKEEEIKTIINSWEIKITEGAGLADQGKQEESIAKLEEVKQDVQKAINLNQELSNIAQGLEKIDEKSKTYYVKRGELFQLVLDMVNKMDECVKLYFQDKNQGEACFKDIQEISKQIEEKSAETKTYMPSPIPSSEDN
jgi:uncharacterized protein YcfL